MFISLDTDEDCNPQQDRKDAPWQYCSCLDCNQNLVMSPRGGLDTKTDLLTVSCDSDLASHNCTLNMDISESGKIEGKGKFVPVLN